MIEFNKCKNFGGQGYPSTATGGELKANDKDIN